MPRPPNPPCYYCESTKLSKPRADLLWKSIHRQPRIIPLCKSCQDDIDKFLKGDPNAR